MIRMAGDEDSEITGSAPAGRDHCALVLSDSEAGNRKQKGHMMIIRLFKRQVASEAAWLRITQALVLITGCLILVLGLYRLADLELKEAQLLLGIAVLCSLWLQCGILYVLLDPKRRTA